MRERLDKAIARVSREVGIDRDRLRTWVAFMAFCGLLEHAIEEKVIPSYYIKGGVALELRFADRARTTKDIDIGLDGDRQSRLDAFDRVIVLGFDEFRFRRKGDPRQLERADTLRLEVAITYAGRPLQTLEVDLGPGGYEYEPVVPSVRGLDLLGVPVTSPVRCLTLPVQIAQKLHASTNPTVIADPKQNRARDIMDIVLIDMLGQLEYVPTRVSAELVFSDRGEHAWPPALQDYPDSWKATLQALAVDLQYPDRDPDVIIARFREILATIRATTIVMASSEDGEVAS